MIDYSCWKREYETFLKTLSKKKVLMLFSGGKDSSLALHFISLAGVDFQFSFEVHAGVFPVHRYSATERNRIDAYWSKRNVDIVWHEVKETDDYIKSAENPCLPCQSLRKNLLKVILTESSHDLKDIVIIINFNLWDIVSYAIEHILMDIFSESNNANGIIKSKRFTETAQRFYPLIKMKEGYTVYRPLIKYNGNDIDTSLKKEGIPILSIPCKYGEFRPKRIFEEYYKRMSLRFDYENILHFAKEALNLPEPSSYTSMTKEEYLSDVF